MPKRTLKDNEFMILRGRGKFDVIAVDEKDICIKKTLKGKEMLVAKHEGRNLTKFAKKELLDKHRKRCYKKSFKKNTRKASKRTLAKRRTKRLLKKSRKSKSKSKGGKSIKRSVRRIVRKK